MQQSGHTDKFSLKCTRLNYCLGLISLSAETRWRLHGPTPPSQLVSVSFQVRKQVGGCCPTFFPVYISLSTNLILSQSDVAYHKDGLAVIIHTCIYIYYTFFYSFELLTNLFILSLHKKYLLLLSFA